MSKQSERTPFWHQAIAEAEARQAVATSGAGMPSEDVIRQHVDKATAPLLNKLGELEFTFKEAAAVTRSIVDAHAQLFSFEQRLGAILHLEGHVASDAIKDAEVDRVGKALEKIAMRCSIAIEEGEE